MQHLTGHGSLPTCGTCRQSQLASFSQARNSAEQQRLTTHLLSPRCQRRRGSRLCGTAAGGGLVGMRGSRVYACAHNNCGLGHATWSATVPVSQSPLVSLKLLVSLISCIVACSARIETDRQTDRQTDRPTHRPSTVTLAAHVRRRLIMALTILHRAHTALKSIQH